MSHFINSETDLSQTGLNSTILYSTTTKAATATLTLSKRQAKINLDTFANGKVSLLVTTTVAEEGIDIAAANCVIRFDPILNSVSFVQGRGRARQKNSSFVVMSERGDRTVNDLSNIETLQSNISTNFKPSTIDSQEQLKKQRNAQLSRERNVTKLFVKGWTLDTSLQQLNLLCRKTKVTLMEEYSYSKKDGY